MKRKTITIIFLIYIFSSCINKGLKLPLAEQKPIKVINIISRTDSIINNLSDLASDIQYVPLRTPDGIQIGSIDKVILCANKIYISSVFELICFDNNGYFLYRLPVKSLKPGESINFIDDFDISSDDKTLVILSSNRIILFHNTGTEFAILKSFILKKPLPSKIDLVPDTNRILLSIIPRNGNESNLSLLVNFDGDTIYLRPNFYKFKKYRANNQGSATDIIHYKTGNCLCFKELFSDTVFSINKESSTFKPWLILDSRGKNIPPRAQGDPDYRYHDLAEYSNVEKIFEASKYIIYYYSYHYLKVDYTYHRKILYDKSTDTKIELNQELKDDLCGGPDFDLTYASDGKLYSSVYAIALKKYIAGEVFKRAKVKDPEKKMALKKLIDSFKDTDNTVLIVVTPKK